MKWRYPLASPGLAGVSATKDFVVVASRNANDTADLFLALDPGTGVELWEHSYPAQGKLDYGNSPRATPLIADPFVFTLGAFGHLCCLDIDTGKVVWQRHLVNDLGGTLPEWGFAATPLIVDGRLVVTVGGEEHALIALHPESGEVLWKGIGIGTGYAAPIVIKHGEQSRIVAYEGFECSAWDAASGERLWSIVPEVEGDFNVPTPIATGKGLVLCTENNATRLYPMNGSGKPVDQPQSRNLALMPDAHTPVVIGDLLLGVQNALIAIDLSDSMKTRWTWRDPILTKHCSLIACEDRLLIITEGGQVVLLRISEKGAEELGRFAAVQGTDSLLAHPAMLDRLLLIRTANSVEAYEL